MRTLILGAGFGGLELATRLSEELGDEADVVLVDAADGFVFGFSKLDVMFSRSTSDHVVHPYAGLDLPGVEFVQATVTAIDPASRRVVTSAGELTGDVLVVALGADLHPELTPGLVEGGHEFYSVAGAFAVREVLERFDGGRIVVGVTSTPFKCPPAPSETALMLQDMCERRGLTDRSQISLAMPFGVPIPPSPDASAAILAAFEERGIAWLPRWLVRRLDPGRAVAISQDGEEIGYDLFLGVPVHRAPAAVVEAGMTEDGWIPIDPETLQTRFESVYAVGDVTSVGTPKAGVFAEGQAAVVATEILQRIRGTRSTSYDGRGICYMEFGHDEVAKVDVTFLSDRPPAGTLEGPGKQQAADKNRFGAERVHRWFHRAWSPAGPTQPVE